jgi:fumarylpyruvate hydrolase
VSEVGYLSRGRISVEVNGTVRQQGDLSDMIWDVPHVLHFLSQYYELLPGDLVFTGTPAGVAAVVAGDTLIGRVESLGELKIRIEAGLG